MQRKRPCAAAKVTLNASGEKLQSVLKRNKNNNVAVGLVTTERSRNGHPCCNAGGAPVLSTLTPLSNPCRIPAASLSQTGQFVDKNTKRPLLGEPHHIGNVLHSMEGWCWHLQRAAVHQRCTHPLCSSMFADTNLNSSSGHGGQNNGHRDRHGGPWGQAASSSWESRFVPVGAQRSAPEGFSAHQVQTTNEGLDGTGILACTGCCSFA